MSSYAALLDANVLYPAPLRDLLIQLAHTNLFKANWTADIHREWIEALQSKGHRAADNSGFHAGVSENLPD